jgi:hypothetical protein
MRREGGGGPYLARKPAAQMIERVWSDSTQPAHVHCRVGYNEFDFFLKKLKNGAKFKSKTHLLNTFSDFWRRFLRVWLQSLKKVLKNFVKSRKVSKNAEFHADFKSVEKFFKNAHKQSYKQNKFD